MIIVAHPDLTGYAPRTERWHAYDDDTYDGAEDAGPQIVGLGATPEEAIADYWSLFNEIADDLQAEGYS
jgi:hypothetical protein